MYKCEAWHAPSFVEATVYEDILFELRHPWQLTEAHLPIVIHEI